MRTDLQSWPLAPNWRLMSCDIIWILTYLLTCRIGAADKRSETMRDEATVGQSDIIELGAVTALTRGPVGNFEDILTNQAQRSMGLADE